MGERFGDLTVTEVDLRAPQTPSQRDSHRLGARAAQTKCDCGGELFVIVYDLVRGKVTDCGCKRPARPSRRGIGGGRKPQTIPAVELYQPLIDEFLAAALLDASMTVDICKAAVRIENRRRHWQVRLDLRAAEAAARDACAASTLTGCEILNPCGTGPLCPWAAPQFAHIDAPPIGPQVPGGSRTKRTRPQPRTGPGDEYTVESVLHLAMAESKAS